MACVRYEVRAQEPVLVQPLSTAESYACFLTNLDQAIASVEVEIVFVFDALTHCHVHPAKLLKEALRKVLVPFYPLAGRLCRSPRDNSLFIQCNAQGVSFVEADANVGISDLGDLSQPDSSTLSPLVFHLPATDDRPLLSAQVTRFKCGGFVLGVVFQHCLCDGVAFVQFVNAWAETVRGVPLSAAPPVLDRTFLRPRSPLQIKYPHNEFLDIEDVSLIQNISVDSITRTFCFAPESLEILKKKALEDGVLSKCTTFEALAGLIWMARTTAMWSDYPEQKVKLLIGVSGRSSCEPAALPKGYLGNGLLIPCALASARELEENPLSHAVKHVQHVTGHMREEYMRSQIDYMECHKLGFPPLGATLSITTWCGLAWDIIDFGWGKPKYVGPVSLMSMQMAIFFSYGQDKKGINVVLALPPKEMHKFEEILYPHLNPVFLSVTDSNQTHNT